MIGMKSCYLNLEFDLPMNRIKLIASTIPLEGTKRDSSQCTNGSNCNVCDLVNLLIFLTPLFSALIFI